MLVPARDGTDKSGSSKHLQVLSPLPRGQLTLQWMVRDRKTPRWQGKAGAGAAWEEGLAVPGPETLARAVREGAREDGALHLSGHSQAAGSVNNAAPEVRLPAWQSGEAPPGGKTNNFQ